ncbi:MAG: 7-cyano-7-deazaguanine synthase QueC [Oligoflexia bacterium]|nr:7-cyano-7-deazaguanine synthase QueC [Oligoflexia bacterium]MBF0364539.1 7-cyano-7-deazaguanine synthase QueC [Oligoflexia bacterium]
MTKSIVLVSGGMDSLVTAAIAHSESKSSEHLYFLHMNYGQKTESKELWCFHKIADHYQVLSDHRKIVDISFLKEIGGSSLTDSKMQVSDFKGESTAIPTSYVPFRNTIIISLAVAWAEVVGAVRIYIGAVHEDSSGYPDCRPSYYKAMNKLIHEGTKATSIHVVTPVIHLSKDKIIQQGVDLHAPFEYTWSCYKAEDAACGVCDSCALRLRAFARLGMTDPIKYRS